MVLRSQLLMRSTNAVSLQKTINLQEVRMTKDADNQFWSSLSPRPPVGPAQKCRQEVPAQSEAWRNAVFSSEERLAASRRTTAIDAEVRWQRRMTKVSGALEKTACLLVDHLWAVGLVSRWKPQALNLLEIAGPDAIPDLLVELNKPNKPLHFVEIKPKRFVTTEVREGFERERQFLNEKRFGFHVWTNSDVLGGQTPHTLSCLRWG